MKFGTLLFLGAFAVTLSGGVYVTAQAPAPAAQTPPGGLAPPSTPAAGGPAGTPRRAAAAPAPRRPDFPQQTRKLASPEVIARGKAVFGVNCVACHGADLRGGDMGGPNLLRSQVALSDQHGELILPIVHGARQDKGMPAFNLSDSDVIAIAEYIHSVLAQVGVQGRPPGSGDAAELKVIVGDPAAGKTYFDANCAGCHSVTGDLAGIGAKYTDGRTLQNTWVAGIPGGGGRGFGPAVLAPGEKPTTVTVSMANGNKVEGTLLQQNDFIVTLIEPDGTRRSIDRNSEVTNIQVHDPADAHKKLALTLNNKEMHDVTAYLATIK